MGPRQTDNAQSHQASFAALGDKVARLAGAVRAVVRGPDGEPGKPGVPNGVPLGPAAGQAVFENYVKSAPSVQATVDIFKGEWASQFPPPHEEVTAGPLRLFADDRLLWMLDRLGGAAGMKALELGPLDGGHSYMLREAGASSVKAIEGNVRAYLRCLIVKEIFSLDNVNFLCGDFMEWLRANDEHFDLGVASGVLYHMHRPVELLELLSKRCDVLFLWTHYYDHDVITGSPHEGNFGESVPTEWGGFSHTLHRHFYGPDLEGFCGGNAHYSMWMERAGILGAVERFGYRQVEVGFDEPDHQNGPCLALLARRG